MDYRKFSTTYVVSLQRGEEIVSSLQDLCAEEDITLGYITGIGAAEKIELGYYNVEAREYSKKMFSDEHEIVALTGNVTTMASKPYIHLHITIGNKNFETFSGHLSHAVVSGACEIFIQTVDGAVERVKDEKETGLNVLDLT